MNENLAKVIAYLESANRGESSMSEEVIEKAGEDFKEAEIHYARSLALCDEMHMPFLKRKLLILAANITKSLNDYHVIIMDFL